VSHSDSRARSRRRRGAGGAPQTGGGLAEREPYADTGPVRAALTRTAELGACCVIALALIVVALVVLGGLVFAALTLMK
jgi:hypothetical protein